MNPNFVERETVLAECPSSRCRRKQRCERKGTEHPCLKTHEHADAVRDRISAFLGRTAQEFKRRRSDRNVSISEYELECRLRIVKQKLEEREAQWLAEERAREQDEKPKRHGM